MRVQGLSQVVCRAELQKSQVDQKSLCLSMSSDTLVPLQGDRHRRSLRAIRLQTLTKGEISPVFDYGGAKAGHLFNQATQFLHLWPAARGFSDQSDRYAGMCEVSQTAELPDGVVDAEGGLTRLQNEVRCLQQCTVTGNRAVAVCLPEGWERKRPASHSNSEGQIR